MASLLETLRNSINPSVYGRRLGLTPGDFLVGPKDIQVQVEDFTTTAAATANNYGVTRVLVTGSSQTSQFTVALPQPGVRKSFILQSTSTGTQQFILGTALIFGASLTTVGSTMFSLVRQGASINLIGLTTALWGIMDIASSLVSSDSRGVIFTTST